MPALRQAARDGRPTGKNRRGRRCYIGHRLESLCHHILVFERKLVTIKNYYNYMIETEFRDKFIGFVDILGFKNLVEASEAGTGVPLTEILEILKKLGSSNERQKFDKHGPKLCPQSEYIRRDLDFRVTPISDCVIASSEVSPAGAINLIFHCWGVVINLLQKGIMCRGYITRGSIYHTDSQVMGSGYQRAYAKESNVTAFKREADERGTPFVEIDPVVCNYITNSGDKCVKEMFSRCVKDDGENVALFPFKRLSHSFIIGGFGIGRFREKFDVEKEKKSNQNLSITINNLKQRIMDFVDKSNENVVRKAEHYIQALNAQLVICDDTDKMIDKLNSPFTTIIGGPIESH